MQHRLSSRPGEQQRPLGSRIIGGNGINGRNAVRGFGRIGLAALAMQGLTCVGSAEIFSASPTENFTVQPAGPRAGTSGTNFFNIEANSNGTLASYGVMDIARNDLGITSTIQSIDAISLRFMQTGAAFALTGLTLKFYITEVLTPISTLAPVFQSTEAPEGLGTTFDTKHALGEMSWEAKGNLAVDTYRFSIPTAAKSFLINQLNTEGSIFRIVIAPGNGALPTDPKYVTDWYGKGQADASRRQLISLEANVERQYWDTNGSAAGVGGLGTWNAAAFNWNITADGTGAVNPFDSLKRLSFLGTAADVMIDGNVTANGGLEFGVGGYTVKDGTLTLGTDPTLYLMHPAAEVTTIQSVIAGANGLKTIGTGSLVLAGLNTFSGNVSAGTALHIASDANLGAPDNDVVLEGGSLVISETLSLNAARTLSGSGKLRVPKGKILTVEGDVNLSALELSDRGTIRFNGLNQTISTLRFGLDAEVNFSSVTVLSLTGLIADSTVGMNTLAADIDLGGGFRVFNVADGPADVDVLLTGALSGTTAGRLHKVGSGVLEIAGSTATYSSPVRLGTASATVPVDGGTLRIQAATALGSGQFQFNAGTLDNASDGLLSFSSDVSLSIGAGQIGDGARFTGEPIEFAGEISIFAAAPYENRIRVDNRTTFTGNFVSNTAPNSNAVAVLGTGTLVLDGAANTVTEPFTVDGPTLLVNGSLSASLTTVKSGVLGGAGLFVNDVVIGDGLGIADAILAPGEGDLVGTLGMRALSLLSDAQVRLQINGELPEFDALMVNGLSLGDNVASLQVSVIGDATLEFGNEYLIFENAPGAPLTGNFQGLPDQGTFLVGVNQFEIDYGTGPNLNSVILRVIPEPASMSLLAFGALAVGCRRRRRSQS